jgi:hypothetical protein
MYDGEALDQIFRIINTKRPTINYHDLYKKLVSPYNAEEEKEESK